MVAYGAAAVPCPVASLPELADTNTPNLSVKMHGSVVFDGKSPSLMQSAVQTW
jgi:hypothetical protein